MPDYISPKICTKLGSIYHSAIVIISYNNEP